jgi:hypothetical protein
MTSAGDVLVMVEVPTGIGLVSKRPVPDTCVSVWCTKSILVEAPPLLRVAPRVCSPSCEHTVERTGMLATMTDTPA